MAPTCSSLICDYSGVYGVTFLPDPATCPQKHHANRVAEVKTILVGGTWPFTYERCGLCSQLNASIHQHAFPILHCYREPHQLLGGNLAYDLS